MTDTPGTLEERLRGGKCPECQGWGEVAYFGEMVGCTCLGRYEAPISMATRTEAADEIASLKATVQQLTANLDDALGTPCEQIRSADEIASLRARVEAAEAAQLNLVRRGTHFRNAGIRQAAELVEELSKRPKTQWGEVKASIVNLQDTMLSSDDEIPGWVYDIQYGPEGEADYAWVYDESGRMIATMKTHDAARLAKPRQALKDTPVE